MSTTRGDEHGRIEMHYAVTRYDVVKAMRDLAPQRMDNRIWLRDNYGRTPMHYVVCVDAAKELCTAAGSDYESLFVKVDDEGCAPLHFVYSEELVDFMCSYNAAVNGRDKKRRTPLHYARSFKLARVLVRCGADPNITDNDGVPAIARFPKLKADTIAAAEAKAKAEAVVRGAKADLSTFDSMVSRFTTDAMEEVDEDAVALDIKINKAVAAADADADADARDAAAEILAGTEALDVVAAIAKFAAEMVAEVGAAAESANADARER